MKQLILTPETLKSLEDTVKDYMIQTRVRAVLIINTAGQVVFRRGIIKSDNFIQSLGALTAGIFNATISIAKLLGDRYFDSLSQEGSRIRIFYTALNEETIMISLYDTNAIIGEIKVMSERARESILGLMEEESDKKESSFDDEYKNEVENLIDNMFD